MKCIDFLSLKQPNGFKGCVYWTKWYFKRYLKVISKTVQILNFKGILVEPHSIDGEYLQVFKSL